MENSALPASWANVAFEELLVFILGGDWGKDEAFDDPDYVEVLCIRASELKNWENERGETAALRKIKKTSLEKRMLLDGDIIIEVSGGGPDQPVGRTALIDRVTLSKNPGYKKICTNFFRLIRPANELNSKYLNHYFQHFYKSGGISEYQAGSNNLRNLKFNDYIQIGVPLAPLNEQKRIVAKIEVLFSELDNGITALKTAREQLKVYRQAMLKHAFEGKFTAKWREENADKLEATELLLTRIQKEREDRYKQQLSDWKAAVEAWEMKDKEGKKPSKPKKLVQLKTVAKANCVDFPVLPQGWSYVRLGTLIDEPVYGTSAKCEYESGEQGVLRIPNIADGVIDDSDLKLATFKQGEVDHLQLKSGDILTIRSNGSISLVGNCALISEKDTKYIFAGYLIRLRPNPNLIAPAFLLAILKCHLLRKQIESAAKSTSGVNNINSKELQNLVVPLPSIEEQHELLSHFDSMLPSIIVTEKDITNQLNKAETLRQSILEKAFSGQLVLQDPNDEPASELLTRIKSEKETVQAKNTKKKLTAKRGRNKAKEGAN